MSGVRFVWSGDFILQPAGKMLTANQRNSQPLKTDTNDYLHLSRSVSHIPKTRTGFSSFGRLRIPSDILWCYFEVGPAYANIRSAMLCCRCCFSLRANRPRCLPNLPGLFCSHFFFCALLHFLQYVFLPSLFVLST